MDIETPSEYDGSSILESLSGNESTRHEFLETEDNREVGCKEILVSYSGSQLRFAAFRFAIFRPVLGLKSTRF